MTYNDAYNLVKEKRSVINPNEGFKAQLKQLDAYMKNKRDFHESQELKWAIFSHLYCKWVLYYKCTIALGHWRPELLLPETWCKH